MRPARGVQHHAAVELVRVFADRCETSPVMQGTPQADPGLGVDDREPPRPASVTGREVRQVDLATRRRAVTEPPQLDIEHTCAGGGQARLDL